MDGKHLNLEKSNQDNHADGQQEVIAADEYKAMVKYMLKHNQEHLEELKHLFEENEDGNNESVSGIIEAYRYANDLLEKYVKGVDY